MSQSYTIWLLIALACVAANLPFLSHRLLGWIPLPKKRNASAKAMAGAKMEKSWLWHLIELCVLYALVLLLARFLEGSLGQVSAQGWEFYVVTVCLFLTCAFPGFVYRYLWRRD